MSEDSIELPWTYIILKLEEEEISASISDFDGEFYLSPVPNGTYTLYALRDGYEITKVENVRVFLTHSSDVVKVVMKKADNVDFSNFVYSEKEDLKEFLAAQEKMDLNTNMVDDKNLKQGSWTHYYDKPNPRTLCGCKLIESFGEYLNNIKNGQWNYYNINGDKIRVEIYQNGELISTEYFSDYKGK